MPKKKKINIFWFLPLRAVGCIKEEIRFFTLIHNPPISKICFSKDIYPLGSRLKTSAIKLKQFVFMLMYLKRKLAQELALSLNFL